MPFILKRMIRLACLILFSKAYFAVTWRLTESLKCTFLFRYNFLLDRVLSCPPAAAFSTSCFQEMSTPADKLVPANLSKKRQPATSYGSSKTRSERSCPQENHLFLPFPYTSLGTEQRATPTPKKELTLS